MLSISVHMKNRCFSLLPNFFFFFYITGKLTLLIFPAVFVTASTNEIFCEKKIKNGWALKSFEMPFDLGNILESTNCMLSSFKTIGYGFTQYHDLT